MCVLLGTGSCIFEIHPNLSSHKFPIPFQAHVLEVYNIQQKLNKLATCQLLLNQEVAIHYHGLWCNTQQVMSHVSLYTTITNYSY